jgi:hypothetical protein
MLRPKAGPKNHVLLLVILWLQIDHDIKLFLCGKIEPYNVIERLKVAFNFMFLSSCIGNCN